MVLVAVRIKRLICEVCPTLQGALWKERFILPLSDDPFMIKYHHDQKDIK